MCSLSPLGDESRAAEKEHELQTSPCSGNTEPPCLPGSGLGPVKSVHNPGGAGHLHLKVTAVMAGVGREATQTGMRCKELSGPQVTRDPIPVGTLSCRTG